MIFMKSELARPAASIDEVRGKLQIAVELELSTIPTYLYALYSMPRGTNTTARGIVRSVVVEEMLHMALACNLLNAIGGAPVVDDPAKTPRYPGLLPGSVTGVTARLAPISLAHVEGLFMEIEEPEHPLVIKNKMAALGLDAELPPPTIGAFYRQILADLDALGAEVFTGDPQRQLSPDAIDGTIPVTSPETARKAILTIVEQGEGTDMSPQESPDSEDPAHYYRFQQIVRGRRLVRNPTPPPNPSPADLWVFGPDPVDFDPAKVLPLVEDPTSDGYPEGSPAKNANDAFNRAYTDILKGIHRAVNGEPDTIFGAVGVMVGALPGLVQDLVAVDLGDGRRAGPTFQYLV
jgi:hypothetical protein